MRENDGANMEGKYGRNIFVTKVIRSYRAIIPNAIIRFPCITRSLERVFFGTDIPLANSWQSNLMSTTRVEAQS